jgi:hypothetical protein
MGIAVRLRERMGVKPAGRELCQANEAASVKPGRSMTLV